MAFSKPLAIVMHLNYNPPLIMKRSGNNIGGYFGERIHIGQVLEAITAAAASAGWSREVFHETGDLPLLAFKRSVPNAEKRIYVSAGIHGDEPAAPMAVLKLLVENSWPANADIWLCPCLNPVGFVLGTRENAQGHDLNRQYRNTEAAETAAHIAWLAQQPEFDLCLCLHEDWESSGFYLYEINPDGKESLAPSMIEVAKAFCPIDLAAEIDGRPAKDGIIRLPIDPSFRPLWPEAFYLFMNKTRVTCTLEAPSDFALEARVNALTAAVRVALE